MLVGDRQQPVTGIRSALKDAEDQQSTEQRQTLHQYAAVQRADDRGKQPQGFVHHADLPRIKPDAADQEGGGQTHGESVAELIKDNQQQDQPGIIATKEVAERCGDGLLQRAGNRNHIARFRRE